MCPEGDPTADAQSGGISIVQCRLLLLVVAFIHAGAFLCHERLSWRS